MLLFGRQYVTSLFLVQNIINLWLFFFFWGGGGEETLHRPSRNLSFLHNAALFVTSINNMYYIYIVAISIDNGIFLSSLNFINFIIIIKFFLHFGFYINNYVMF